MTSSAPRTHGGDAPDADLTPWHHRHHRHHRALGLGGAAVALGMTVLWVAVVPDKAAATSGPQSWAIRWGHPASWACLAGLGVAVATGAPRRVREGLAWSALGAYAAFLVALVL